MIRKFGGSTGIDIQPQGLDLGIGSGSIIKSIQRGTFSCQNGQSGNISIANVNMNAAIVNFTVNSTLGTSGGYLLSRMVLTSNTNLYWSFQSGPSYPGIEVSWEVIEFNNIKSLQTIDLSYSQGYPTLLNIGIASVNMSKTMVIGYTHKQIVLTSPTNVSVHDSYGSDGTFNLKRVYILEFN